MLVQRTGYQDSYEKFEGYVRPEQTQPQQSTKPQEQPRVTLRPDASALETAGAKKAGNDTLQSYLPYPVEAPKAEQVPEQPRRTEHGFGEGDGLQYGGKTYRLKGFRDGYAIIEPDKVTDGDARPIPISELRKATKASPDEDWMERQRQLGMATIARQAQSTADRFGEMVGDGIGRLERAGEYARSDEGFMGVAKERDLYNPDTNEVEHIYTLPDGRETTDKHLADAETQSFREQRFALSLPGQIQAAQKRIARLEEALHQRAVEYMDEQGPFDPLKSGFGAFGQGGTGSYLDRVGPDNDDRYKAIYAQLKMAGESLQQLNNAYDQQRHGRHFFRDFGRGLEQSLFNAGSWDLGVSDLRQMSALLAVNRKIQSGQRLTREESDLMAEAYINQCVMGHYGSLGNGYTWGGIAGYSIPFMAQMMATGGFGGLSGGITKGLAKAAAKKGVSVATGKATRELSKRGLVKFVRDKGMAGVAEVAKESAARWAIGTIGVGIETAVIRAPLQVAAMRVPSTVASAIENKLGEIKTLDGDNFWFENDMSWGRAGWEAFADEAIEQWSEMMGAYIPGMAAINKAVGSRDLGAAMLRMGRSNKFTRAAIEKAFGAKYMTRELLRKTGVDVPKAMAVVNRWAERANINGYVPECLEEYIGQGGRTVLGLETAYTNEHALDENGNKIYDGEGNPVMRKVNSFLTSDFHGDIWGGMAMSLGMTGAVTLTGAIGLQQAGRAVNRHALAKAMGVADRAASTLLTSDVWTPMREIIDMTDNANIGDLFDQIKRDKGLDMAQKQAVVDYMTTMMARRGSNLREFIEQPTEDQMAGQSQIDEAFTEGAEILDADGRNKANLAVGYQEQRVRQALGIKDDASVSEVLTKMFGTTSINEMVSNMLGDGHMDAQQRTMVMDYLMTISRLNGVRMAADAELAAQQKAAEVALAEGADKTDKEHPVIRTGTLRNGRGKVSIISGAVTEYDDGSGIDLSQSDNFIVVREEGGAVVTVDAAEFESVDAPVPLQQAVEQAKAQLRQEHDAAYRQELEGLTSTEPGQSVPVMVDGRYVNGQVQSNDGAAIEVALEDGTVVDTTPDELQEWMRESKRVAFAADMDNRYSQQQTEDEAGTEQAGEAAQPAEAGLTAEDMYDRITGGATNETADITGYTESVAGREMLFYEDGGVKGRWVIVRDADEKELRRCALEMGVPPDQAVVMYGDGSAEMFIPQFGQATGQTAGQAAGQPQETGVTPSTGFALDDNLVFGEGSDYAGATARIVSVDNSDAAEPHYVVEYTLQDGETHVMFKTAAELAALQAFVVPEYVPKIDESVPVSTENPISEGEIAPETFSSVENVQQDEAQQPMEPPAPQAPQQSALDQIPTITDSRGKVQPQWTAVEPGLAWDGLVERTQDEEMAQSYANNKVDFAQKALEEAQKAKPKAMEDLDDFIDSENKRKKAIADAQAQLDAWKRIAAVAEDRRREAERQREAEIRAAAEARRQQEEAERAQRDEEARILAEELNGVPEWTTDTPEDARRRGHRRVSGAKVERQGEIPAVAGKEVDVNFAKGRTEKGRVVLIDANQAQPSHLQGDLNPLHFIPEAQPKDRNDGGVSTMAADDIAGNIKPKQITATDVTAYVGAPTVNRRGEVIQGNNRVDALRLMWERYPEQAAKYKQYLIDNAQSFSLNPADINGMERPILVNMLDVDDDTAIKLGQYTGESVESGGEVRLSPTHLTTSMGKDMETFANILLRSNDEEATLAQMIDSNGLDVLKWMSGKGYITPTQYKTALDSRGGINAEARNDLRNVLYESVFKGGAPMLKDMFANLPAAAQNAILSTAFRDQQSPRGEKMLAEIQESIIAYNMMAPTLAVAKNLEQALNAMNAWRHQTQFDDISGETVLPSERFSNFALQLAAMYHKCTQRTLQGIFNGMFDLVQGTAKPTLFELTPSNEPIPLADAIRRVLEIDYQPVIKDNDDGQIRDNDVAVDSPASKTGQPGGSADTAGGEQSPQGEQPADGGAGAAAESRRAGEREALQRDDAGQDNLQSTETDELEPIGEGFFGKIYNQFKGKVKEAFDFLVNRKSGDLLGVFHRDGIGDIDLVWGNASEKTGLDHIIDKHVGEGKDFASVEEAMNVIDDVINNGDIVKDNWDKVTFDKDGKRVVVRRNVRDNNGNIIDDKKNWVVTSFDNNIPKSEKKGTATRATPGQSDVEAGAVAPNLSDGKGTTLSSDKQIGGRESSEQEVENEAEYDTARSVMDNERADVEADVRAAAIDAPTAEEISAADTAEDERRADFEAGVEPTESMREAELSASGYGDLQAAVEAASAEVDTNPTEAQKEAGNYKKGHVTIGDFDITIENPAGSVRSGVDANGKKWETKMENAYGYIKGTESTDGDHIDVFLAENMDEWNGRKVYVVDQTKEDGTFDEHKVMLGFNDGYDAMQAYLANHDATWQEKHPGLRISEVNIEDFKAWIDSSHRKTKPFADYVNVPKTTESNGIELIENISEQFDPGLANGRPMEDLIGSKLVFDNAKQGVIALKVLAVRHPQNGEDYVLCQDATSETSIFSPSVEEFYNIFLKNNKGKVIWGNTKTDGNLSQKPGHIQIPVF